MSRICNSGDNLDLTTTFCVTLLCLKFLAFSTLSNNLYACVALTEECGIILKYQRFDVMKFFGEWIPQNSSKRKIKGYIDGSDEHGYGDTIKYFEISKNGSHKIWGSKINKQNKFKRGGLEYKNSAKVSKLDGWDKKTSFVLFMMDMEGLNESFGYTMIDSGCNIIFYPKEQFSSPQRVYSQHSYWEEDVSSVTQLLNVYPTDSNYLDLANLFDSGDQVPTGQITFFSSGSSIC